VILQSHFVQFTFNISRTLVISLTGKYVQQGSRMSSPEGDR
jgi:hypothetical protein